MQKRRRGSILVPVLLAVSLLPRLVVPDGIVLCIETCGDLAVTVAHSSHSCAHAPAETAADTPPASADHDHGHGHRCHDAAPVAGSGSVSGASDPAEATPVESTPAPRLAALSPIDDAGCTDVSGDDTWTRVGERETRDAHSALLPVLQASVAIAPPDLGAAPLRGPAPAPFPRPLGRDDVSILPLRV